MEGKRTSSEVPQRTSPTTPRTTRQLKTPGADNDSIPSPHPVIRTPKEKSPKVTERRSPRSPASEKKRPGRVSELESQLAQLQQELRKTKDQLSSSESWKRRALQEAEEAKKQLAAMSTKLEDTEQQLLELSASEESRVQELRKISQDRDRAWQSELEAVQKHHSMDSAALTSALNEIPKLKMQLDRVAESEAAHARRAELAFGEMQGLRLELTETLDLVEKLKTELSDCKESEVRAVDVVNKTQIQLEAAKSTEGALRSEGLKATEANKSLATELGQSKTQVSSLEELVKKLQADQGDGNGKRSSDTSGDAKDAQEIGEHEDSKQLKAELSHVKIEVGQLRSALELAERRYQEEYIQSTLQIRSAYELAERTKSESCQRETESEAKLRVAKAEVEELKGKLLDKETKLQSISEENEGLNLKLGANQLSGRDYELEMELKKAEADLVVWKASLLSKDSELQSMAEENEMMKLEIKKRENERSKANDETLSLAEAAMASEREALMKLGYLTEEADKSSRKAARVTEQLDAAQAVNSEMEAELRKLKVQSDQWRKAAEAAAAMLSNGGNGKYVERTGSLDNSYHTIGGKLSSPLSEDLDDDSPKKKNGNMLKKIGVMLKKGQK
ncbi:hypothetical protein RJ639_030563 [Escallonia herrerae]|uniref:Uncharacterized protein n=1 Tax=Escallonia herrerae TaxID=1293975 RepID=A0AA88X1X9_9ASTE|nr:hypothetical protein RJ639_030563 [Escallonia herrerae]